MPEEPHRLALVGAGLIAAAAHLPHLTKRTDVTVGAIVDPDRERAEQLAAEFNVPQVETDLDRVLAEEAIGVVDFCTPPILHAQQLNAAMDANKHIIMEKPVATALQDAKQLAERAASYDRTIMIAENWAYSSAAAALTKAIREERLGEVYLWTSRHESDHRLPSGGQPAWNYRLDQSGGGYLMQAGTHPVTLGRHLFGDVQWVAAVSPQNSGDGGPFLDEDMVVTLRFTSGVIGNLVLTARSRRTTARVLSQSVFGTEGVADADILTGAVDISPATGEPAAPHSMGYEEEFAHFFDCVRTGQQPLTSVADQAETIRTIMAIYHAASSGTRVELETFA